MSGINVTITINKEVFGRATRLTVTRDLENISGTFELTIVDEARIRNALIAQIGQPAPNAPIKRGDPIGIAIDDEPVMIGYINRPKFRWVADRIECHITGRDRTGDLVDCAALPNGPTEFKGVDLLHVANQVAAPFNVPVIADVDIGAPFDRLSLHKHMTAMAFLESAARQRSVLLTSDGVGRLLLTRGGSSRGPAALAIGENVFEVDVEYDEEHRFSDYYVMQDTAKKRSGGPALDHMVEPLDEEAGDETPGADSAAEATAIGSTGHAIDPEITRYRPTVRLTRSQSGMSTVQEQAEWALRVAKGQSDRVHMTVLGFRAGQAQSLWRPNQVVSVWDPYSGIDRDMLIAGVTFALDEAGATTKLRVAGVTAYDRINEADRKRHRATAAKGPLDSSVTPLSAP